MFKQPRTYLDDIMAVLRPHGAASDAAAIKASIRTQFT
jgi:hypothetical protein